MRTLHVITAAVTIDGELMMMWSISAFVVRVILVGSVQGRTERSIHRTRTEAWYSLGARHDWSKKLPHFEHKLVCRFINLLACSAILDFKNYQAHAAVI